jgi:RNA polymerase sigma-70 factor (ECF subfamily)
METTSSPSTPHISSAPFWPDAPYPHTEPTSPRTTLRLGPEDLHVLERIARRTAGQQVDWEDLLQDCLLRMIRSCDRFEPGTNLYAWAKQIMRRLLCDELRKRRSRASLAEALSQDSTSSEVVPEEQQAVDWWTTISPQRLQQATESLPEHLRQPFSLSHERKSYREIADLLGLNPRTVGTRLFRAKARLRKQLVGKHTASSSSAG